MRNSILIVAAVVTALVSSHEAPPRTNAWTLCKIMGWSSLSVAMRYIHPSEDRVLAAFAEPQLGWGGDKIGDNRENAASATGISNELNSAESIS